MNQDNVDTELISANQQLINSLQSLNLTPSNSSKRKKFLIIFGIIALVLFVLILGIKTLTTNRSKTPTTNMLSIKNPILLIKLKKLVAIDPANPSNEQLIYETKDDEFLSAKWSPDRKKLAYIKQLNGFCNPNPSNIYMQCSELGIISMDTKKPVVVYTAPFSDQTLFYDWKDSDNLMYLTIIDKVGIQSYRYNLDTNNSSLMAPSVFGWDSALDLRGENVYLYSTSQQQTDINQPPDYNASEQYYIGKLNIENPVKFEKVFNLNSLN